MDKKHNSPVSAFGQEHWEKRYDTNEPSKNMKETQGSDFAPKKSAERKTTYVKVNKWDY